MGGTNSTNGIAWLHVRGLTLRCSQQDGEFTSWRDANILIWPSLALANQLAAVCPATSAFLFQRVCKFNTLSVWPH